MSALRVCNAYNSTCRVEARLVTDVMNLYSGTPQPKSKDEFSRLVKACFDGVHGVTFVNKTVLRGTRDSKRAVLRGVKIRYADALGFEGLDDGR